MDFLFIVNSRMCTLTFEWKILSCHFTSLKPYCARSWVQRFWNGIWKEIVSWVWKLIIIISNLYIPDGYHRNVRWKPRTLSFDHPSMIWDWSNEHECNPKNNLSFNHNSTITFTQTDKSTLHAMKYLLNRDTRYIRECGLGSSRLYSI